MIEAVKNMKGEIKVAEEPVRIWTELKGNIFEKYLADQRRYAALFQVLATYTCFKNTRILQKEGVNVIVERGGEASYRIFTKANVEEGFIDEAEMGVLEFLLKSWEEDGILGGRTDAHIFIRVSKETAKVRMGLRNREGEGGYSDEYLDRIWRLHEEWLMKGRGKNCTVVIDGEKSKDVVRETSMTAISNLCNGKSIEVRKRGKVNNKSKEKKRV